ncbi:MAG TPA: long-chain fatty acid--CoA ligase [Bryobacteraceae bacterium]|jgi:long-chain acyl-CoA synthetase|nr:long-chain fatty acid--CoA ligase [Bryobacteraceae bacterium]
MPGRTIFTVLAETASKYGDALALHQPTGAKTGAGYRTYSWNEWRRTSEEIALGLSSLGLARGEIVCILSETRAEFYLVDLGIMGAGGVAAALYTAYPMPDLAKNIHSAEPRFLFVENAKTHEALQAAVAASGARWPEHVIVMTGEAPAGAMTLETLEARGRELLARDAKAFERLTEDVSPEDPAILYLTSGATGEPKMGLSSHAAVLANMDMAPVALPIGPEDSMLVFLPSAHIAQRIVLEMVPMRMGTPVWFSESLAKLPGELRSVRPTIFLAPPRVWERMYATIQTEIKKRPAIARKIFHGALGLGLEAARYREEGKALPLWLSRALKIANKVVFGKIRERLGGRIRIAASGAAPLGKDLAEFYSAIGMPLVEGYGLTEAGVISFNPIERPKPGSIGKLLPGVEARLAEDGELQVRTPCLFMGYYHDEAATRSVMTEDGWFSTGDIAQVDEDGYWYITGRKKELIVSSNGKKIYPARIENLFKVEPLVNQVLLVGDKKPYVTALFTLNAGQLKELKGSNGEGSAGASEETVNKAVQSAVARVNKQLAEFERIRRFKILDRDFSIERGELTPTMKIRRAQVLENNRELVNQLYLGREDSP